MTSDADPAIPFRWVILFGCWCSYFAFGLTVTGLAPMVALIVDDLDMSSTDMGTVLGAWQFIYIFSAIPVGMVLQRFGPQKVLLIGMVIIASSGLLRGFAESYPVLFWSVALFGIGGPIVSAGLPQIVNLWFPDRERGLAMGVYITGLASGGIVTLTLSHPVMLPLVGDSWRSVLHVWAGVALTVALIWAVIGFLTLRLDNKPVLAGHTGGGGIFGHFRSIGALIRNPNVCILLFIGTGIFVIDHGFRNWMPEIIREQGWQAEQAGYLAAILIGSGLISALVLPRFATVERRLPILRGLFVSAGVGCFLVSTAHPVLLVMGLAAIGTATGIMMVLATLTLIGLPGVGAPRAGVAGGLYFSVAEIGGVGGPVLIGAIHDATLDFNHALWTVAAIAAILYVTSFLAKTHEK